MKHLHRALAAATVATMGLMPVQAWAVPTLQLTSGGTTVTITDGGAGDANSAAGAVTFIGSIGDFFLNVSTGLTKPALGSATKPDIDLNSVNSSTSAGTLTISFSETDYIGNGNLRFKTDVGGTTQGEASFTVYGDATNTLFGTGTTLASLGAFSGGAFSGSNSTRAEFNGPYSLTQVATITHPGSGTTSYDIQTTIPVPATLGLIGIGLVGLGVVGRRRRQTADFG
jgi:hypothetical protein